jgi:two-component system, NarL family, invasion response regulator UvrY
MPRLLIVDDHEAVRKQLRRVFEQTVTYQVCAEAADGLDAVHKFRQAKPDLIVMDFNMPRLNGIDASRKILKDAPETPILMLTVFTSEQLIREAKHVGIRGFCSKSELPCIMDAVQALVDGQDYFRAN